MADQWSKMASIFRYIFDYRTLFTIVNHQINFPDNHLNYHTKTLIYHTPKNRGGGGLSNILFLALFPKSRPVFEWGPRILPPAPGGACFS